tara:strand:- start:2471 stop:2770 length:300 start_codon:yes stop_codon:yes gene_type:complete
MAHFSEDAVYVNIPMEPANEGIVAIRAFIDRFIGMASEIEFIVHHQIDNGEGVIMNERTDRFFINDAWLELQVMGTFELANGKITHWRDYFDMAKLNGG